MIYKLPFLFLLKKDKAFKILMRPNKISQFHVGCESDLYKEQIYSIQMLIKRWCKIRDFVFSFKIQVSKSKKNKNEIVLRRNKNWKITRVKCLFMWYSFVVENLKSKNLSTSSFMANKWRIHILSLIWFSN